MSSVNDELILDFLAMAGRVDFMLLTEQIEVEKLPTVRSAKTQFLPWWREDDPSGPAFTFELTAEPKRPADPDKWALGVSVRIHRPGSQWEAEGEIGWCDYEIGWDNYLDHRLEAATIEEFIQSLPGFIEDLLTQFRRECDRHLGGA